MGTLVLEAVGCQKLHFPLDLRFPLLLFSKTVRSVETNNGKKMLKIRLFSTCAAICLTLYGCSDETTPSSYKSQHSGKKLEQAINPASRQPIASSGEQKQFQWNPKQQLPVLPNRSELRVLFEETKKIENGIQHIMKNFAELPNDQQSRKAAKEKFKKTLPSYKEKMLVIGKMKLKEAKQ